MNERLSGRGSAVEISPRRLCAQVEVDFKGMVDINVRRALPDAIFVTICKSPRRVVLLN
jgi:hypothetical protein